jgi:hypothetical protein
MKKVFMSLITLLFLMTACAPVTPAQPPQSLIVRDPTSRAPKPTQTSVPAKPLSAVEETVVKQLAGNLGLKASDISVMSNNEIEFNDACMGVSMPDLMCAQVVTPGRVIVLKANGLQYEYHTNADGSRVQPATLALTWKREGGIAGFCDNLTVFLSGEVYGSQCKTSDGRMGTFASLLSVTERKQFSTWTAKYGQVNVDASDPKGVADGMTVLLSLYGNGTGQPSQDDKAAIFLWVQNLYLDLYK